MLSFEQRPGETATPTPVEDGDAPVGDVGAEPTESMTAEEAPTSAAARMLELAAVTADRLVTDAETEAASLVSDAQARADAILEGSRNEADRVAAELAGTRRRPSRRRSPPSARWRATTAARCAPPHRAALEARCNPARAARVSTGRGGSPLGLTWVSSWPPRSAQLEALARGRTAMQSISTR